MLLVQVLEDERLVKADTEKAAELAATEAAEVPLQPMYLSTTSVVKLKHYQYTSDLTMPYGADVTSNRVFLIVC
jgi:hypothetical protein